MPWLQVSTPSQIHVQFSQAEKARGTVLCVGKSIDILRMLILITWCDFLSDVYK